MSSEYVPHARSTQQQPVTAQVDLSFDEVANLFPFPIAEAASTLGVSTNDLKRVCRENGLNRWPYRKILAGKTVEDVKKEAAREMVILERMSRLQPQATPNAPSALRSNRSGAYTFAGSAPMELDRSSIDLTKRQPVGPAHGLYAHASSLKPLHIDQRPQLQNQFHLRVNIPTYLDEFRQGFPNKGLASVSTRWWGTALPDKIENKDNAKKVDMAMEPSVGQREGGLRKRKMEDEGGDCIDDSTGEVKGPETGPDDLTPASMLARTRKNAVVAGKKALGMAVTRGYGAYHLADKDEALLRAVFANNFPSLWESSTAVNQVA